MRRTKPISGALETSTKSFLLMLEPSDKGMALFCFISGGPECPEIQKMICYVLPCFCSCSTYISEIPRPSRNIFVTTDFSSDEQENVIAAGSYSTDWTLLGFGLVLGVLEWHCWLWWAKNVVLLKGLLQFLMTSLDRTEPAYPSKMRVDTKHEYKKKFQRPSIFWLSRRRKS